MSLWERVGCQTDSKVFEKLIVEGSFEDPVKICKIGPKRTADDKEFKRE